MKRSFTALAALAALAVLCASAAARADDPAPPRAQPSASGTGYEIDPLALPPGDTPEVRYPPPIVRLKLIAAGIVVTGLAWGVSFACAASWPYVPNPLPGGQSGPPGSGQLKPIAGPWIALGLSGCAPDEPDCGAKVGIRAGLYVLDGIMQLAGVALIVEGIVMKTSPEKKRKTSLLGVQVGGVELTPVPVITPTMTGLGVGGTF